MKPFIAPLDQSDEASVAKMLGEAVDAIGAEIGVAVNTIGISPNVPIEEQALDGRDGWRNVFEVNVHGCFLSTRAIAERMKSRGVRGTVLLITSTNGINSQSQISTHYDSSKAAQGHMMKIFAEHYAPSGIRINGLAPGWIETSLNDTLPDDERAKEIEQDLGGTLCRAARDRGLRRVPVRDGRVVRLRTELHGRRRLSLAAPVADRAAAVLALRQRPRRH